MPVIWMQTAELMLFWQEGGQITATVLTGSM